MILLQGLGKRIQSLRFSPDGRHVAAVDSENELHVWADPVQRRKLSAGRKCQRAEFLATGGKLLLSNAWNPSGDRRHPCLLHDLAGGPDVELPTGDAPTRWPWCAPTPDGQHFLHLDLPLRTGEDTVLSLRRLDAPAVPLWRAQTSDWTYASLAILSSGTRFALFHKSALVVRNLADGTTEGQVANPDRWAYAVTARDGPLIAGRVANRVAVYRADALTAAPVILKNDGRREFTGLAFHPSGRFLAATSNDATVKVYDTATWAVVHVFTWQAGKMRSVAFSPDGMLAAAGSDKGTIVLWDWDL